MIGDTPYIIVDNQRLHPISRAPKIDPTSSAQPDRKVPHFGVVDRVTISTEALERYRQYQSTATANTQKVSDLSEHQQATAPARLSDLPKSSL